MVSLAFLGIDNITNMSNGNLDGISSEIIDNFSPLIGIIKAIGVVFLIYIIILIISSIYKFKLNKKIKFIYKKIQDIDNKLDKVIKEKENKKKINKKNKK